MIRLSLGIVTLKVNVGGESFGLGIVALIVPLEGRIETGESAYIISGESRPLLIRN